MAALSVSRRVLYGERGGRQEEGEAEIKKDLFCELVLLPHRPGESGTGPGSVTTITPGKTSFLPG